MEIRIKLKQARKENKLTQRDVASHLEMAKTSYQRIELGLRGTSEENWLKLFNLFNKQTPLNKLMEKTPHRYLLAQEGEEVPTFSCYCKNLDGSIVAIEKGNKQ